MPGAVYFFSGILLLLTACDGAKLQNTSHPLGEVPPPVPSLLAHWILMAQHGEPLTEGPEAQIQAQCQFEEEGSALGGNYQWRVSGSLCPIRWNVTRTRRVGTGHRVTEVVWSFSVERGLGELADPWSCFGVAVEAMVLPPSGPEGRGAYQVDCGDNYRAQAEWEDVRSLTDGPLSRERSERLTVQQSGRTASFELREIVKQGQKSVQSQRDGQPIPEEVHRERWNWVGFPLALLRGESVRQSL